MGNESLKQKMNSSPKELAKFETMPATMANARSVFAKFESRFNSLAPDPAAVARMKEWTLTALGQNPRLQECTLSSLFGGFMTCVSLNLVPNHPHYGHAYLIPRKCNIGERNKPIWAQQAVFQVGYKGAILILKRTGVVANVYARNVYAGDGFDIIEGYEPKIIHRPDINRKGEGGYIGTYAIATLPDGSRTHEWVNAHDMERIRKFALGSKASGPWIDWPEEMKRKTAVFRLQKMLPQEPGRAIHMADNSIVRFKPDGEKGGELIHQQVVDAEFEEAPEETAEATPTA